MEKEIKASAVIIRNGKVLLQKSASSGAEEYVFPEVEMGVNEDPEVLLKKKINEEFSVPISIKKLFYKMAVKPGSEAYYYLCSVDEKEAELYKYLFEKGITPASQKSVNLEWVGIQKLQSLNLYPIPVRDYLISKSFTDYLYTHKSEKYLPNVPENIEREEKRAIGGYFGSILGPFDTLVRVILTIVAVTSISLAIISYFGEIRIEFVDKSYYETLYQSEIKSGAFWPTVRYITKKGNSFEIFPKSLTQTESGAIYVKTETGIVRVSRDVAYQDLRGNEIVINRWLPVVTFSTIGITLLYIAFRPRKINI